MFYSLPTETKLDIFKLFTYQQLCSIKQTNLYFRDFIYKFEGELARQKNFDKIDDHCRLIRPKVEDFDFPLDEKLEMKLKNGLENPIPLYLPQHDLDNYVFICLSRVGNPPTFGIENRYLLQLPTIIKNKNQMKIVYHYLNKLFNCSFESGYINEFVFNPKLIELLFGNAKRFYIQNCTLLFTDHIIENIFHFILNHLAGGILRILFFRDNVILEKYRDSLIKILINVGVNFKEVNLLFYNYPDNLDTIMNATLLYEYIVELLLPLSLCR
uniref:Uncharacterized protein n=1 Tax=Meloidogyne enterolobii TaxID=390850 RepID=A0A6V7U130_MELEN|nr:unnamed protein product [Meloidogyne enterolobii]